ncbi:MFS family permease [Paraburkholderia bannensis]|uniref:MFS family permease n=1 Tax=Paraburkholderia bannensis TaxID=765414 RepID=A0A7W9U152_9BURK|nr:MULTISPECIES: MFS transporter [Paraburkholderia]MBB3262147.1 MFS family permease [Paraburkholderia sp. WP4_3_2]MBB6105142.1 MFS family permease [Paraburkholderia bannensis]
MSTHLPQTLLTPEGKSHDTLKQTRTRLTSTNIVGLVLANTVEFFDFFIYAMFAGYIGRAFFPQGTLFDGLQFSLATFAAGYLSRPLGALTLGRYADRRGRKKTALLTGSLITLGSLAIAVVPSFDAVGLPSSLIVLLCRMIQGFAIGGELGAVTALLVERGPAGRPAMGAGYQMAAQGAAQLLAGILGLALVEYLPAADLHAWGWRLPFAFAAALLPVQFYLRRSIEEVIPSPEPDPRSATSDTRSWIKPSLCSVGMIFGGTVPTFVVIYIAAFGLSGASPSPSFSFAMASAIGAATLLASLIGAALADKIGTGTMIVIARTATAIAVYPVFALLSGRDSQIISVIAISTVAALSALAGGPTLAFILRKFPARHRATGLAFSYATGVAIFGGTTPLIASAIVHTTGSGEKTAWYVIFASVVALIAQRYLRRAPDYEMQ